MSKLGKSNAGVRVTPEILLRLVACIILAGVLAWVGGQFTGMGMFDFADEYTFPFYFCVAIIGMLVINPAVRKQRQVQEGE